MEILSSAPVCFLRRHNVGSLVLVLSVLLVGGCATPDYVEPRQLPTDAVLPTIEATAPVWIRSINGKRLPASFSDRRVIRLAPGAHVLELSYSRTEIRREDQMQELRNPWNRAPKWHVVSEGVKVPVTVRSGYTYVVNHERKDAERKIFYSIAEYQNLR